MIVGDMVRYAEKGVELNIGMIVHICEHTWTCEVMWDDGEVWAHDADEFEVINEQ